MKNNVFNLSETSDLDIIVDDLLPLIQDIDNISENEIYELVGEDEIVGTQLAEVSFLKVKRDRKNKGLRKLERKLKDTKEAFCKNKIIRDWYNRSKEDQGKDKKALSEVVAALAVLFGISLEAALIGLIVGALLWMLKKGYAKFCEAYINA